MERHKWVGIDVNFVPAEQFEEKDVSLQRIVTQFSMMNPDDEEFCICH